MSNSVIVFDIDGTLSDCHWRREFVLAKNFDEFNRRCGADEPHDHIVKLCNMLFDAGHCIIIMTGRPDNYRSETIAWFEKHGIKHHSLIMRPRSDLVTSDLDLKQQWISEYSEVEMVFDDRPCIVEGLRAQGYKVLSCGEGW